MADSGVNAPPRLAKAADFQITCHICNRSLELAVDMAADAEGKAIHETCYLRLVLKANSPETSAPG